MKRVKFVTKKSSQFKFNKKLLLLFLLLPLLLIIPFNKNSKQDTLNLEKNLNLIPTPILGTTFEKGHKIAYLKNDNSQAKWMSVWIYDLDTETERQVMPEINPSVICPRDACPDRSFSLSPDGTKLAVDLVSNGNETGLFQVVDINQSKSNCNVHRQRI